jgi:hypothetical protein
MNRNQVELIRKHFKKGERVKLISMNDPYTRLKHGDKGIITDIDDIGQIHVHWDCGSTLALNYVQDNFITINEGE